ncbi:DUF3846 domain-containing protein [Streptomyces cyaneofuscatus]|uniref:DUF3846 domain-containing protein n=1 Tax=Streptomyces cyaneofuscatus TaxID=66883 RepID=UPI0036DA4BB4
MITGILLPCEEEQPIKLIEFDAENPTTIREMVGGTFEAFNLDTPSASILANDKAMLWSLPFNHRATVLLWLHAKGLRGQAYVSGDAVLTGVRDKRGRTKSVPDELATLLLDTESYGVEFLHRPDGPWSRRGTTFTDWFDAYNYAIVREASFATISDARVVGTD